MPKEEDKKDDDFGKPAQLKHSKLLFVLNVLTNSKCYHIYK